MTIKRINTVHELSDDGNNLIDIGVYIDKGELAKFALNYRAQIKNDWHVIYRVDNFHGFFHEQKFWISKEPIKKENEEKTNTIKELLNIYLNYILENWPKFREYYIKSKGE